MNDETFLKEAIELATEGVKAGEGGPFGALVVKDGEVVGRGWNRVAATKDPTAHAEINAIRDACQRLDDFQLEGCILYSSSEPCPMCLGAIYWARPAKVVFATSREEAARAGFDDQLIYEQINVPPEERTIPALHIPLEEGKVPFQEWNDKEDKVIY